MPDYFSVPIFFIVFRKSSSGSCSVVLTGSGETIEAAIIVGVLLSFVEQLMTTGRRSQRNQVEESTLPALQHGVSLDEADRKSTEKLLRRMRIQIWAGTLAGFFLALCIGAAFIAVVSSPPDRL
jgi:high-affinity iron transporter